MDDPFLLAAAAAPHDQTLRLIYADWLEERGDPRAEFVRLQVSLLQTPEGDPRYAALLARKEELRPLFNTEWLLKMGYSHPVERDAQTGCEVSNCPRRWNDLRSTERPDVRFCGVCRQHVHFCGRRGEIRAHLQLGHVVAVPLRWRRMSLTPFAPDDVETGDGSPGEDSW